MQNHGSLHSAAGAICCSCCQHLCFTAVDTSVTAALALARTDWVFIRSFFGCIDSLQWKGSFESRQVKALAVPPRPKAKEVTHSRGCAGCCSCGVVADPRSSDLSELQGCTESTGSSAAVNCWARLDDLGGSQQHGMFAMTKIAHTA